MAKIKACKDCRYSKPGKRVPWGKDWDFAKCHHPKLVKRESGVKYQYHLGLPPKDPYKPPWCEIMRRPDSKDACGIQAVYFEPRKEE